jgi:hypothetical protein
VNEAEPEVGILATAVGLPTAKAPAVPEPAPAAHTPKDWYSNPVDTNKFVLASLLVPNIMPPVVVIVSPIAVLSETEAP